MSGHLKKKHIHTERVKSKIIIIYSNFGIKILSARYLQMFFGLGTW